MHFFKTTIIWLPYIIIIIIIIIVTIIIIIQIFDLSIDHRNTGEPR